MSSEEELDTLIKEAMPAKGDFIEFAGMNCNDWLEPNQSQCLGWDGVSRRCECGNRRVYWDTSVEGMVFGQAD